MLVSTLSRIHAHLESPRAPLYAALLGLLVSLPTLGQGLLLDDHLFRARAEAGPASLRFDLLDGPVAQLRERGTLGWWASDDLQLAFFRPLASLWHSLDFHLWPAASVIMHLENVLLYAALIVVVGRLLQRWLGPGPLAGLACLMFAFDELHATTVMWISARNTLLAALFALLALLAHSSWRTSARSGAAAGPMALLASTSFGLALAAGEIAVAGLGYVVADALVCEQGVRGRIAALWPYVVLVIAWRAASAQLGLGAHDSGLYIDPASDPRGYASSVILQTPALAFAVLSLPIADGLTNVTEATSYLIIALGFALLAWLFAPLRDDLRARSLALGLLLAALPLAATAPTSRTTLLLGFGGVGLVALAWGRRDTPAFSRPVRRHALRFVMACHLVLAPLLFLPLSFAPLLIEAPHRELAEQVSKSSDDTVALLNLPTEITALYPAAIASTAGNPWPPHCYPLFAGMTTLEVERIDTHTLLLHSQAGWAAARVDRLSRAWTRQGMAVGDRIELERAFVEIVEVGDDRRPRAVRVRFAQDLDDIVLLGFDGAALVRWAPAIGERREWTAALELP